MTMVTRGETYYASLERPRTVDEILYYSVQALKTPVPGPARRDCRMIHLPSPCRFQIGLLASLLFALTLAACSPPVQVDRVDVRSAYDQVNRTALSSDQLSEVTRTVLRQAALLDDFDAQPDAAIAALRAQAIATGMHWPALYALSEMNYHEGLRTKSKAMLLASALYAYAVLFPSGDADRPSPYSAEFLQATDFYDLALTQVLSGPGAEGVANLQSGRYEVPFGTVDVAVDPAGLQFAGRALTSFVPTMNLTVKGISDLVLIPLRPSIQRMLLPLEKSNWPGRLGE
jgi:hypothetical protein